MMLKLFFVGTLHKGFTPVKELEEIILKYNPNLLLVEISEENLKSDNIDGYPEEMIAAVDFANKKGIKVKGFDLSMDVTKQGTTSEDEDGLVEEQAKIISKFDWKEFNKEEYCEKLGNSLIDNNKWDKREKEMEENIRKALPTSGTALILTGCSHLFYFEKKFSKASFPFR